MICLNLFLVSKLFLLHSSCWAFFLLNATIPQSLVFDQSLIFSWWFHWTVSYHCHTYGSLVSISVQLSSSFCIVCEHVYWELITLSQINEAELFLLLPNILASTTVRNLPIICDYSFFSSISSLHLVLSSMNLLSLKYNLCCCCLFPTHATVLFSLPSLRARLLLKTGLPVSCSSIVLKLGKLSLTL